MKIIQTIYIKYALEFNVFWILNFLAECSPDWSGFSILVYYFNYQVILVRLARPKESIPVKIQRSKTAFECTEAVFIHLSFFVNTLQVLL